jgi:hypothetical protein
VDELDEMIVRTEAACVRHRHDAAATGLSPLTARMRRDRCLAMEKTLARLQAQRAALDG